jgi:Protein of unknown function (DUF3532).
MMEKTDEDTLVNFTAEGEQVYVPNNHIESAKVTAEELIVTLRDGRTIHVPLSWFSFLANTTPQQRQNFQARHHAIDWPELDDGVSLETILLGRPAR